MSLFILAFAQIIFFLSLFSIFALKSSSFCSHMHVNAIILNLSMKAKKSYGQHFLIHDKVASDIASLISPQYKNYPILEVGPGKGKLTRFLHEKEGKLTVVEADRDMVDHLNQAFTDVDFTIIQEDFLKLNLVKIIDGESVLIGNFPYNISTQIVFKMLESRELIPQMIGMFQKEVADRILASPGSKTYGILSVITQAYYSGKKEIKLAPGNFNPPPRVESAVIKLTRLDIPRIKSAYPDFLAIVKTAFGKRRKMLRNSLNSLIITDEQRKLPMMCRRPEELSVEEFDDLCLELMKS